jgi:hypothetical protein
VKQKAELERIAGILRSEMRLKIVCVACLLVGAGILLIRMHATKVADPLSGAWTGDWGPTPTHRNSVIIDLKWDGKTVTGAVNPGPDAIQFKNTSYDVKTSALHLELDAPSTGNKAHYVVNGVVEDGTLIGTWTHDSIKGNFRLIKRRAGPLSGG